MATIGVLPYSMTAQQSADLKQSSHSVINNNNTIGTGKVGGKLKRNVNVLKKRPKPQPLTESSVNIMTVSDQNGNEKIKTKTKTPVLLGTGITKTKSMSLPLAVARRNARERNRVKQVNNGFAALRERIPEEVAEAFESQGNGRGSAKKLSKVETLRMAVEYIRSLEKVLAVDAEDEQKSFIKTENTDPSSILSSMTTPPPEPNQVPTNFEEEIFITTASTLPEITMINGHQYMRIPGTNTYQLISTTIYQNNENIHPNPDGTTTVILPATDYDSASMMGSVIGYTQNPVHIMTPASVSPGAFSGQSMSPGLGDSKAEHCYVTMSYQSPEHDDSNCDSFKSNQLYLPHNQTFEGVLTLKTEIAEDEILLQQQSLSAESMMEAMEWWGTTNSVQQHHQSETTPRTVS